MATSQAAGGLIHSSSDSGLFFQGDGQSQVAGNARLSVPFANTSNAISGSVCPSLSPLSPDMSNTALNSVASAGSSVGASFLGNDANSGLSRTPHFQGNATINTESYVRLPASPLSFVSNNLNTSGSTVMNGSSSLQLSPNQNTHLQQAQQNGQHHKSMPNSSMGQVPLHSGSRVSGSLMQEPNNVCHAQKKPRLEIKQEDVLQQLLQRQDSMQLQNPNPMLQSLIQQQRLRQQQQQLLQAMPHMQRVHFLQQQQLQLRQQLQQQGMHTLSSTRHSDVAVCSRRLMQYLYHQRRPPDNSIAYWRKFVAEYYSPHAKQRWCLSLYENVGQSSLGVFPQASMSTWKCDICGSKSGRGFEATFEVLPRLNEIKYASGVMDELLFLDLPCERRFSSGIMILEYRRAVQESVYEQLRVVREGQLRILFTPELKILSWEFCTKRHEEFLPRQLIAPLANQLLQVAQKCQSTLVESGSDGVPQQGIQANSNMVVTAGRQLCRSLESQSVNDLGFSKRFVRCLQIAEVVNSMTDLMRFCREQKVGPTEGLKNITQHVTMANLQQQETQETEQARVHGVPKVGDSQNKQPILQHANNSQVSHNSHVIDGRALNDSAQNSLVTNNQTLLSIGSNTLKSGTCSSLNVPNQNPASTSQVHANTLSGNQQNSRVSSFSISQMPQPQQQSVNKNGLPEQSHPQFYQKSNILQQQQLIQHITQDTSKKSIGAGQDFSAAANPAHYAVCQKSAGQDSGGRSANNCLGFGNNTSVPAGNGTECVNGIATSRSNGIKTLSNTSSPPAAHSNCKPKAADTYQNLHLSDEMVQDMANELFENGFFNNDFEDSYGWKL